MHDHGISLALNDESENIVKHLAISQTRQLQLFSTDLPSNF